MTKKDLTNIITDYLEVHDIVDEELVFGLVERLADELAEIEEDLEFGDD